MAFNHLEKLDQYDRFAQENSGVGSTKSGAGSASRQRTKQYLGLGETMSERARKNVESSTQGVRRMFAQVDIGAAREERQNPDLDMAAWVQSIEEEAKENAIEPPTEDPDVKVDGDIIAFIAGFEGFKEKAYDDYGQISIGFGTKATDLDQTITREEALKALSNDVLKARTIVLNAVKEYGYDWSENQIDALTSFTYNTGQGNFSELIKDGTRGDEEISEMMLKYNKAGGKVLPGLTKRRKAEATLFTQGYK